MEDCIHVFLLPSMEGGYLRTLVCEHHRDDK